MLYLGGCGEPRRSSKTKFKCVNLRAPANGRPDFPFFLVFWVLAGACQRHGVGGFLSCNTTKAHSMTTARARDAAWNFLAHNARRHPARGTARERRLHLSHIRNTPNFLPSSGERRVTPNARPSTARVSAGSMTPSSQMRAEEK